jgi:hypothetical protein
MIAAVLLFAANVFAVSAEDIRWGQDVTSNLYSNTLKQWTMDIDGRVGGFNPGTGNIYYVDSGVTNAGDGKSWANAVTTLDAAINLCTANNGDVIYVAPGHNEALIAADGVDADVAGVTIIGCSVGTLMPTFDYDHADGEFVIGAANVTIYNLRFNASVTIVTHAIDVENAGDYARIIGCSFPDGELAATDEFVDTIQVGTTATDVTISGCYYFSTGTGSNNFVDLSAATIANPTVTDNIIYGAFAEAGIWAGAAVPTNCNISRNTITNTTTGQFAIEFQGAATGICIGNMLYTDTYATTLDPGSLMCLENYSVNAIDTTALLVPASSADYAATAALVITMNDDVTSVLADTAAWDTSAEARTLLFGSDTAGATAAQALKIDGITISTTPTAASLASFIAGVGGLGTQLGTSKSLVDVLGTNGVALVDDAVSIAGIIGLPADADNAVVSTAITANADGSLYERDEYAQQVMEKCVSKSQATIATGDLFAVAGGPIEVVSLIGVVTNTIQTQANSIKLLVDPTAPATDTDLCTATEITTDAIGTVYVITGTFGNALTEVTAGVGATTATKFIIPIGMIELNGTASNTGTIVWYLRYKPLALGVTVTAQ